MVIFKRQWSDLLKLCLNQPVSAYIKWFLHFFHFHLQILYYGYICTMCFFFCYHLCTKAAGSSWYWNIQSREDHETLKAEQNEKVLSQQTTTSRALPNVDSGKPKCSLVVCHKQCYILNKLLTGCATLAILDVDYLRFDFSTIIIISNTNQ